MATKKITKKKRTHPGRPLKRIAAPKLSAAHLINQLLDKNDGSTLVDIAEIIKCSHTNIWSIYRGRRNPVFWIVINLCTALDVDDVDTLARQVYDAERARKAERLKEQAKLALERTRARERANASRPQIKRKKIKVKKDDG